MERINILCATDKNFLNPAYVTIASVIENHKQYGIHFFVIIDHDIDEKDCERLKSYVNSTGNEIDFLAMDIPEFENFEVCERFTRAAYFRLMAHKYLPKNIDRILYLDVDIIVDQDISEFYFADFQGKYLLATSHNPVPDYFNMLDHTLVNLESAAKGEFFNSGVLVFNIGLFRKNISIKDYADAYAECDRNGIQVFYDQGLLNYMFYDKTRYFSSMDYNYRYSIPKDYSKRIDSKIQYKKAIIHFTGMKQPYKPWDIVFTDEEVKMFGKVPYENGYFYVSDELNKLMLVWWKYAKLTPVYEELVFAEHIKHKWFSRNLLPIFIKHNDIMKKKQTGVSSVKEIIKEKQSTQYPAGFKHRAYKLGCLLLSPYYFVRAIIRKIKKRDSK